MALVVIAICDEEDGGIDISAKAEPFVPGPDSDIAPTPAQTAALIAIAAIGEALSGAAEVEEAKQG